ncbi:MAG: hypothetical protein IJ733_21390 [Lachnospiraceae bacterium]|nr:hypothetical protein [Lachnospiraceae bacterium]
MAFDENSGINKMANVLSQRMKKENASPLVLDFGEIKKNGSLVTNTFPVAIPKGSYSVCRQLTLGETGKKLTTTSEDPPEHKVIIPEKMRSVQPGDRVLVAWVQNEAVVIDIITSS